MKAMWDVKLSTIKIIISNKLMAGHTLNTIKIINFISLI